ncbi:MAG: hexokinase [Schwartzia sp. (in: firmicutes)]
MGWDEKKAEWAREAFALPRREMDAVARRFQGAIGQGLSGKESSLRLLPAYVGLPTGEETGDFLTVDFGGTNVRAAKVRLFGGGRCAVTARVEKPLRLLGEYDFTGKDTSAAALFGVLADLVGEAAGGDRERPYRLGHTFSFPSLQETLTDARLIQWTKEFSVSGVEGAWVNTLLFEALAARGFSNLRPVSVINDTVAVLLSAAYQMPGTFIGAIYATGHNTCYYETSPGMRSPTILNLESGGFSDVEQNVYDRRLDAASERPGAQRLEKMTAGRYLGTLYALALADILSLDEPPSFSALDLAAVVSGDSAARAKLEALAGESLTERALAQAVELAAAIAGRSAGLVAASFAGILRHRAAERMAPSRCIAVEGSLYEKFPGLSVTVSRALTIFLQGSGIAPPSVCLVRGGATIGAALSAAMAEEA